MVKKYDVQLTLADFLDSVVAILIVVTVLLSGPVFIIRVFLQMEESKLFCLLNERLPVRVFQNLPKLSQLFANFGVVHVGCEFCDSSSPHLTPYHKSVHWSFDVICVLLALCGVCVWRARLWIYRRTSKYNLLERYFEIVKYRKHWCLLHISNIYMQLLEYSNLSRTTCLLREFSSYDGLKWITRL